MFYRLYKHFFYACYTWSLALEKEGTQHKVNAIYMMSFLMALNFSTIPAIVGLLFSLDVSGIYASWEIYAVVGSLIIMAINFYLVNIKIGCDKLESHVAGVCEDDLIVLKKHLFYYVLISVFLPILCAVFLVFLN